MPRPKQVIVTLYLEDDDTRGDADLQENIAVALLGTEGETVVQAIPDGMIAQAWADPDGTNITYRMSEQRPGLLFEP